MSKRIEKEPDGYIRDLQRKKRQEIKWFIGLNAFVLIFPIIIFSSLLFNAFKPLPDVLITETHVFSEYLRKQSGKGARRPARFLSSTGEIFALKFADEDDFVKGETYEITYYVGLFYPWTYTISNGEEMIVSEQDWIDQKNENINNLPRDGLICFGIYLIIAIMVNMALGFFSLGNIREINHKIEKRRAKRNKKE
ncbi:MAG: hypothetical protein J6S71_07500 [Clostridia bacterium]|nr:hypothetical protein [Clostridia bacterium]